MPEDILGETLLSGAADLFGGGAAAATAIGAGDAIGGGGIWNEAGGLLSQPDAGGMSLKDLANYGALAQGIGGIAGAGASLAGAGQIAGASDRSIAAQLGMFTTQNMQGAPYREAGYGALSQLRSFTGQPGYETGASIYGPNAPQDYTFFGGANKAFGPQDLKTNLAPNYEFMKEQGLGVLGNQLGTTGGRLSGNTLQGLMKYGEDYASNAYQNAFSNFQTNQTNIFNRLSAVAGLGQTANQQSATLAGTVAPSVGNTIVGSGAAQAAGLTGAAANVAGGAANAFGWYALPSLIGNHP